MEFIPAGVTEAIFIAECEKLSIIEQHFNELIFLQGKGVLQDLDDDELRRQDLLHEQSAAVWTTVLSYERLQQFPRKCDDDAFFEKLILNTSKAALKIQNLAKRAEDQYRDRLRNELKGYKTMGRYSEHHVRILEIEQELNLMEERHNSDKVTNYLKSDVLDNEKITPRFLRIAKSVNNDSLDKIRNNDGTVFESKKKQNDYIVEFYRNLYKVPDTMPANFEGCIDSFLGPEICANPLVQLSKLSIEERDRNEVPISIAELDESVKKLNLKSAPGIDGASNKFITKFWAFFREPLHRYATICVLKGQLTETFRTAIIRLIPKKGDTGQLKNWRPISLLSCYYKIISKALNARLGKVIDKVTTSAQKAYNSNRFIHEALINTIETINKCKLENSEGILLSIDIHKAFDSVYHGFMREVYKFFGFGEYFIRLSETLGNGRSAKIILGDGSLSNQIELERCRPQGDSPSPRQFNMCQQICIFKIELDPVVKSVYLSFIVPRTLAPLEYRRELVPEAERNRAAASGYTISPELTATQKKVSSFADDLTAAVAAELETLVRIKNSLNSFGIISGLCTNVEKSTMMRIGNYHGNLAPEIVGLGFALVDSMKLLGFEISNDLNSLSSNFDKSISRMRQIVGNWSRFRLSLPGKISIAKSLLLPQITYPGAILTPTDNQLTEMSEIIENFVTSSIVISKDRIYSPVRSGGLGLIGLKNFLRAQKCSWIRRCSQKINDTWRWEFLELSGYQLHMVRLENFIQLNSPILYNIAEAVCEFQLSYWHQNENYLQAPLFNNNFF